MKNKPYHAVVLSILRAQQARTILDAPCGTGWLGRAMQASAISFDALDGLELWDFPCSTLPYRQVLRHDLDRPLPEPSEKYDAVVCGEAIHLLTNPGVLLESFSRVLRPGGVAIITTPNTWYMRSRLQFLLRGFHSGFRPMVGKNRGEYVTYFPWSFPQLHLLLSHYGFEDITLHEVDEPKPKRFSERLLALPSRLYYRACRRSAQTSDEQRYWTQAGTGQSLYGRWLVVSARKRAASSSAEPG